MIDRRECHFLLKPRTLGTAFVLSFLLYAVIPTISGAIFVVGSLLFVVLMALILVTFLGMLAGIAGVFVLSNATTEPDKRNGCLMIVGGFVSFVLCASLKDQLSTLAYTIVHWSNVHGSSLLKYCSYGSGAELWAWSPFLLSLLVASSLLLVTGILRCEQHLKWAFFKIGYRCPKCHKAYLPRFRCPNCKDLIPDLLPSIYGILHVRCTCGHILPTTDLSGRLGLDKVCNNPDCSADLKDPTFGLHGEYHLAIVGAAASGKSTFMVNSIRQFEQSFAFQNDLLLNFEDKVQERVFRSWTERLDRGKLLDKTLRSATRAFTLSITRRNRAGSRVYIYDVAGEDFGSEEELIRHEFHRFMDGIIFVIDPASERDMIDAKRLRPGGSTAIRYEGNDAIAILARLINSLEERLKVRAGGRFGIPVAVVLTKADSLKLSMVLDVSGGYSSMEAAAIDAERDSTRIRELLAKHKLNNVLNILEARFHRVAYFGVSSLGREPSDTDETPFRPRGVLAPLVWLCFQTCALNDETALMHVVKTSGKSTSRVIGDAEARRGLLAALETLRAKTRELIDSRSVHVRRMQNAWRITINAFSGKEGQSTQIAVWTLLSCGLLTLTSLIWSAVLSG